MSSETPGRWSDVSFDFSGRTVLITGGTNGIGRGLAEGFRQAGATVIVTGTKPVDAYEGLEGLEHRQLLVQDADAVSNLAGSWPPSSTMSMWLSTTQARLPATRASSSWTVSTRPLPST